MQKISLCDKFTQVKHPWKPVIVGELNDHAVKIVKVKGEFPWHFHENEDELFFVIKGEMVIQTRENNYHLKKDEFIIVPRGIEHRPTAEIEAQVMLLEPKTTLNTGNISNEFTHSDVQSI
ncbi:MAG: cupin domain-containing protein [Promethearchaeota archaeon]|nr:MAG: cupin domain-containing protein [Candidatus Lokiarchaeota archaeon]